MITNYFSNTSAEKITPSEKMESGGWVRVERPTDDEMRDLVDLGINADLLSDALDPHEIPRIENDDGWTYFITRVPDVGDDFNDYTTPIMFALGRDYSVTISRDLLGRLWQPFIDLKPVNTTHQTHLFLAMVERILSSYQTRVSAINRQMRAATANITNLSPKDIATFVEYERKLNDYLDALMPTNTALEKTLSRRLKLIELGEDDLELVEDLSVDIEQVIARCKSLLRTITNVRDSYRAVMDTRLNETMRILTVATLSLAVPTMLAGVFGMNVNFPFDTNNAMAFWIIISISIILALSISIYFIRKR